MAVRQRRSKSTPDLQHSDTAVLGPRRTLRAGMEAKVRLPGRSTLKLCRFVRAEADGSLTFRDPRNGGLRTVPPEAVGSISRRHPDG